MYLEMPGWICGQQYYMGEFFVAGVGVCGGGGVVAVGFVYFVI